jgi:hypothetical protein
MWAMWEEKINRACKHSFPHGMERFDIVRGTAAAREVGVREELAATCFGKFTRCTSRQGRNPTHKFRVALIRGKRA